MQMHSFSGPVPPAAPPLQAAETPDNRAMVSAIQQGDTNMENAFCQHYYPRLRRQLQRLNGGACTDDITQDVLITVLLRLRNEGIEQPELLDRYVYQTARYTFLGWIRQPAQQLTHNCPMADDQSEPVADETTEQLAMAGQQRHLIARLIDSLYVERDREVLLRAYILDEPKKSVCHAMTLSNTHFDRIIFRARQRLRTLVEAQPSDVQDALYNTI